MVYAALVLSSLALLAALWLLVALAELHRRQQVLYDTLNQVLPVIERAFKNDTARIITLADRLEKLTSLLVPQPSSSSSDVN
jgi:hypothetical protein